MTFFNQIKDMAKAAAEKTEIIAKNVGEKAEAAIEIQKLSFEISKEQDFINQEYQKIGQKSYTAYSAEGAEIPEFLAENFANITDALNKIEQLNKKISAIKLDKLSINLPKITCPKCGHEILANAKFCPECGAQITENIKEEEPAVEAEIVEEAKAEQAEAVNNNEHIEEAVLTTAEEKSPEAEKPAETEPKTEQKQL